MAHFPLARRAWPGEHGTATHRPCFATFPLGQSSFGVGRDRIHNRSTSYAIHLWLRLAGHAAPCLSALGW